jgi:hypothetical protein
MASRKGKAMNDYTTDFWTETMCLQQHSALRNIIDNPDKFPRADLDAVMSDYEALEAAMLVRHATVPVMLALCGHRA